MYANIHDKFVKVSCLFASVSVIDRNVGCWLVSQPDVLCGGGEENFIHRPHTKRLAARLAVGLRLSVSSTEMWGVR